MFYLFVAPRVSLQDSEGVVGPLTFAVELNVSRQAVVLHLNREGHVPSECVCVCLCV